jgi:hypothetical protein
MGLMKLLAVGRSIGRFGNDRSPFKMTQQSLLPKFGSVTAPEEPARGSGENRNQTVASAALPTGQPQPANVATGNKTMNAVRAVETGPEAEASVPVVMKQAVADRPAFPRGRWTLFKNPFSKSGKSKSVDAPVQTELLLDSVKPVRNDLSDSDLEVVRMKSKPAAEVTEQAAALVPTAVPVATVAETTPSEPVAWDRIKNQFLGAGKS